MNSADQQRIRDVLAVTHRVCDYQPDRKFQTFGAIRLAYSGLHQPICNIASTQSAADPVPFDDLRAATDWMQSLGLGFGYWVRGDNREGIDVLEAAGLTLAYETKDFVLELCQYVSQETQQLAIAEQSLEELGDFLHVMATGFGWPRDIFDYFRTAIFANRRFSSRCFLARHQGRPAAAAAMMTVPWERDLVLLNGAAVLEEARGLGLYRALLEHRLRLARQGGAQYAAVQANTETSAPICEKFGFTSISTTRVYFYDPSR